MVKVYVRAIVPTADSYVLMGDRDKNGKESWDLPGDVLPPGVDVKLHLRKVVLQNTGYSITDLRFFEITCRVTPRKPGIPAATTLDFIFASRLDDMVVQPAAKETDLLRFEKFEWLESDGRFRTNKVMALLTRYHNKQLRPADNARLKVELQTDEV